MKKLLSVLIGILWISVSYSQTITPVYFNNAPTYFPGGSISFHIKPTGVFPFNSRFALQLWDATGTTKISDSIGVAVGFYEPVINGVLPASLAPGNYTLKATAFSTGSLIASSTASSPFSVAAATVFDRIQIENPSTTLKVTCYAAPTNTFGFLDRGINDVTPAFTFDIANATGFTHTAKLIDPNGSITNLPIITTFTGLVRINFPPNLPTNIYTVEVTRSKGLVSSSFSYIYLFNTGNTSLGNTSSENVCANDTVYFSIDTSVMRKNSPRSFYTITYGDGTGVDTFTHAEIMQKPLAHKFVQPTCRDANAINGQFKIEFYLYNRGQKVGSANNCDVYLKNGNGTNKFVNTSVAPTAQFDADPYTCINEPFTVVNQSIAGAYGSSNVCQTQYNVHWYLKPPSGSDYIEADASWSNNPNHNLEIPANILSEAGTWNIVLTAQNPEGCISINSDTSSFCVELKPVPNFTMNGQSSISGCTPLVVNTVNTTNANICRAFKFKWEVYKGASVLATVNTDYTISPNDSASAPVFTFLQPGTYTIRLKTSNSCGDFFQDHIVTIKQNAEVTLPANQRYCDLKSINFGSTTGHVPTFNTNAGTETYQWTISPATYTLLNGTTLNQKSPQVQFNQYTTYHVSLHFKNDCDDADASQDITFDEPITSNAGIDTTVCFNELSIPVLASSTGPVGSVAWTTSGGGSFSNSSSPATIYTFGGSDKSALTVTLSYKVTAVAGSVCTPVTDSRIITIRPQNKVTNSGNISICSGGGVGYTPTATFTLSTFTWTSTVISGSVSGNTLSGSDDINDVLVNTSNTVSAVVKYTVTPVKDGCEGTPSSFQVTVKPQPLIVGNSSINPSTCGGATGSITLTGLIANTSYTVNYSKNGTAVSRTILSDGTGNVIITGLSAGNYTAISVTLAGCPSAAVGPITLADPNPPATPTAGSNGPICSGNTLNLTASTTTPGSVTYAWTGPNTFTSTQQNPSIPNTTVNNSGIYTVTATQNGCTSIAGTVNVTINQTPLNTGASSNSPICSGSAIQLTASSASAGSAFTWSGPNGYTSSLQNPVIASATSADAGTYSLIATLGSCSSAPVTTTVVVNVLPVISGSSFANPTSCNSNTGSITLTGLAASVSYTVSYSKNGAAATSATITSSPTGNVIIASLGAGSYTNVMVSVNSCPSNSVGPFTLVDPNPPATPVASSDGPICSNNTLNLFANSATPGVSYSWSGPNGFTSALQNPSIPNISLAGNGTYQVTATLAGCTSTAGTIAVTINETPATPVISSNSAVCTGSTINLSAASSTAGAVYNWIGPNGFTSTLQNPSIANASTAMAGSYTVTATLGSCISLVASTTVVINVVPVISGSSGQNPTQCSSATGSIQLSGLLVNTVYSVSYSKNNGPLITATNTSDGTGVVTITSLAAGVYSNISVTLNNCPSNLVGPITLTDPNPPVTPVAGNDGPLCSGNTLTLTASTVSVGTATYKWTGPNGFSSTLQNPTVPNANVAASGTYNVTATINACTSAAGSTIVVINQTPATPAVTSNSPVCSGNTLSLGSSTSTPGTMTYAWVGPNGFTSNLQNPSISNVTVAASGTYSVTITATTGNCASAASSIPVVINPTPVITTTSSSNPISCASSTGTITLNGLTSTTTYAVSYLKNGSPITTSISSNSTGDLLINNLTAGTYSAIGVTLAGCPSNLVGPITLTDPNPPVAPVVGSNSRICSGNDLSLTALSVTPGVTYSWTGPNGFSSTAQNPIVNNATIAASGIYTAVVSLANCTSSGTTSVVVNQTPLAPNVTTPVLYCQGDPSNPLSASFASGNTLVWYTTSLGGTGSAVAPTPSTAAVGITSYYVSQINPLTNCESQRSLIQVSVKATPVINGSSSTNPTNCASATGTISLDGLEANTSYSVTYTKNGGVPNVVVLNANAAGQLTIAGLTAGTYTNINVTLVNCPSNTVGSITLTDPNPPAIPVAGSNSPVCRGTTLNLTATSSTPGPVTYTWTSPNGFSSALQNPSILNAPVSASGTYFVTAILANCMSLPASVVVDVQPLPAAPIVNSPVNYCIGSTAVPLTAGSQPGNTLNWYTTAVGGVASITAPAPLTTTAGTTSYFVSQKNPLGCEGERAEIKVTINPDAKAAFNYTFDTSCAPFNINAGIVQPILFPDRNSMYEWYANGALIGSGANFPGFIMTQPGDSVTIKLRVVSSFGCKEDSLKHQFFTKVVPLPAFTVNTPQGCGPLTVQVTNTTPQSGLFNFSWDFGNGLTSLLPNPGLITYQSNPTYGDTSYTITLSAISECDTVRAMRTILVKSKPKAVFSPDKTFGCSPMTVEFANQSLGIINTYTWDFGDGSPIVTTSVNGGISHVYHVAVRDTFYAKLTVENSCGTDVMEYAIIVSPNPIKLDVAVNGNEVFGCAPHTVRFFNNTEGATSFFWNFGDGTTITTTNNIDVVNHTFQTPGTYVVELRATNGCADTSTTETITVYPTPTAAFTLNRTTFCLGDTLRTINISADATRYEWNFGDGSLSTQTAPVHAYALPGTYTVTLRTYRLNVAGNECDNIATQQITVTSSTTGSFTATPDNGSCAPLTVTFANQNLPSVSTVWDFGDGASGVGNTITHTFTKAGTYTVTLTTLVPGGCTYVTIRNIVVSGPDGQLQYTSGFLCGSQAARFEVVATNTDNITWNFGDGQSLTTTDRVVFHTYQNPGAYLPSVTLNSSAGCRFTITGVDSIKVERMTGGFTAAQQRVCGSTTVAFKDTSSVFYGKAEVKWDFGDNTTGFGSNVSHVYAISGTYTVKMMVRSNSGCMDTTERALNIVVNAVPVATILAPSVGCANQAVTLTGDIQSADAVNLIKWTTSNGITSNANPFKFTAALPGTYTVRLIVGTVNGCFDTTELHTIVVNPTPTVIANPDLTLCKGTSAPLVANPANLQYNWFPTQGLSCTTCPNPIATPDVTTPYVVQGTNSFGCSAYDTVVITVIQPLSIVAAANRDSICIGDFSRLSAAGAASYVWSGPNLSSTTISNPIATPTATTTYMVVGSDGFNCFTDTKFVTVAVGNIPTVNLGPDQVLATGTVRPMTSVVTNGPIRTWQWSPPTDLSCTNCSVPSATIKKDITYTVKVTTAYGCTATDTISIKAFCENVQAFVPNAFTPDGDGINDILMVRGSGIAQVKSFRIFNRWGEVVFERANFSPNNPAYGWDGRVKGVVGQPDVYVYTVEVICENGTPYTYKGNVSVLK